MNPIKLGLVVLVAAVTCSAVGYFAGRASAQAPQPRLTESQYNATLPRDVHPDSRGRDALDDEEGKRDYDRHIGPNRSSLAGLQGPGGLRLHGSKPDRIGDELDGRLKELIRLVVSRELDQAFEWTVHEPVALRDKLETALIDVIRHRKPLAGVPEKEAAMIQLGREFFQQHKVSAETYARALKALGPKNLIDMCVLMGDYTETAVLLTVNDVHLPYDVPSLMPVP